MNQGEGLGMRVSISPPPLSSSARFARNVAGPSNPLTLRKSWNLGTFLSFPPKEEKERAAHPGSPLNLFLPLLIYTPIQAHNHCF